MSTPDDDNARSGRTDGGQGPQPGGPGPYGSSTPADEPRYGRRAPDGGQPGGAPAGPPAYGQPVPPPPYNPGGQPGYDAGGQPSYNQPQWNQQGQNQGYGQASHAGYNGGHGAGRQGNPPKRTGAIVMIVVGVLLMVLGPIVGIIAAASAGAGTIGELADGGSTVTNGGSVSLPGDAERVIYVEGATADAALSCEITDPGGQSVPTQGADGGAEEFGGESLLPGVAFTTGESGSYTIDCDLPPNAEPTLLVSPPLDLGNLLGAGIAVLVGFGVGFLGFILLIIGIIWLVRVNKKIRTGQY